MDNLDIVRAVYENRFRDRHFDKESFGDDKVEGYGIGYEHWSTRKARPNQKYAIVLLVDPDISQAELKRLPRQITVNKKDIAALANKTSVPEKVVVKVRYERVKPVLLTAVDPPPVTATGVFTAGEALFSKGKFIGTGGFVFQFKGAPHIVSNHHVLAVAGKGNPVSNAGGQTIAIVTELNAGVDSAMAVINNGANFSNTLPGIGKPAMFGPLPRMSERARKTGASTRLTEINIIFEGLFRGHPTVVGSNVKGVTVPAVGMGDSGSVLVNLSGQIAALVFAGSIPLGTTPAGQLFSNLWAIDIRAAFQGISFP